MNVGLCTISNGEASVEIVLAAAAEAGYNGVEIWGKAPHVGDRTTAECERIAETAREHGLEIPVYGSYLRAGADGFQDDLATELRAATSLGTDLIRVWAGTQEYGDHAETHWEAVVEDLASLADRAAGRGIGVTVEHHAGTLTSSATGARRLVEAVDRGTLGLNYQPSFALPPKEIVANARDLGSLSNNAHVQAIPGRDGEDRCLLEDAYFDVEAVLEALSEQGFDGYVNVEFVTDECEFGVAVERDLAYLRSLTE